jgi:hypothetical protein
MKWLKKALWRWTYQGRELEEDSGKVPVSRLTTRAEEALCGDEPVLNFKVYSAVGGKVVEFRRYDRHKDRNDTTTYIITNDQDFGERIAKIAMIENLKL